MTIFLGAIVIVAAIYATVRRVDVRLALFTAAIVLGLLARQPQLIVREFFNSFTAAKFVVPICTAMGFAHVVRMTGCDQHIVQLLVQPLRHVRALLIPGAVLVGFLVNAPLISQTSTAVCIGPVLIPLLLAARISPITAGAAMLLGASVGGELLNPGGPELGTVARFTGVSPQEVVTRAFPLNLVQLGVATTVFWILSRRFEARIWQKQQPGGLAAGAAIIANDVAASEAEKPDFRVNYFKAIVPLVPLILLVIVGPPFQFVEIKHSWLIDEANPAEVPLFHVRLIGAAMLVGVFVAVLSKPSAVWESAKSFFEGVGYAYTNIVALIVTATCFGRGVELIGFADQLGSLIKSHEGLLMPLAGAFPLSFAALSGSGMAATQSLYAFFGEPAVELGRDPVHVGAVVSLAAAAGRTMSPVAAVTLLCAALTATSPIDLVKRVAPPLLAGVAVMVVVAILTG